MKVLKETDKIKVWVDGDVKYFRSPELNYDHNMVNGFCKTWGKTEEDDPEYSPYGPQICDIEISDICEGVTQSNGKKVPCSYCYKCNTGSNKQNMSLETFKKVIENADYNNQVQSVAFGLGATAEENPDLWDMCDYLRKRYIIPNGTVAELSDKTAVKIAMNFGACAVSNHGNLEVLANTIEKLSIAKTMIDATLKQINIHQVIYQENYAETIKLLDMIKDDKRFKDLNAIVFLGLKKCGRAQSDGFTPLSEKDFAHLIKETMIHKIGYGFDSCSAFKTSKYFNDKYFDIIERVGKEKMDPKIAQIIIDKAHNELTEVLQHIESCESFGVMSSYVNVKGEYTPCSFSEKIIEPISLFKYKFEDIWNSGYVNFLRKLSIKNGRRCLCYNLDDDETNQLSHLSYTNLLEVDKCIFVNSVENNLKKEIV